MDITVIYVSQTQPLDRPVAGAGEGVATGAAQGADGSLVAAIPTDGRSY
jgi:hypothetical protein